MNIRLGALAALLALCIFALQPGGTARAEDGARDGSALNHIIKGKLLRVGTTMLAPMAMLNKNNELVGLEIDVARRLADDLGVSLKIVQMRMPEIINGLVNDRYDVIIAGYSITPARALRVEFSNPYYYTDIHLVASKQAAPGKDLNYFNSPDVTLGLVDGHSEIRTAQKHFPKASLRFFGDEGDLLNALLAGEIPAAVVSDQLIRFNVAFHTNKLYLPGGKSLSTEPIGIAVRKNDYETLHFLNNWIDILNGEGWVKERRSFWYEQSTWIKDIPGEFP